MDYRARISGLFGVKPPRGELVAAVDPSRGQQTVEDVRRFMELTKQIIEQNPSRGIDVGPVEPNLSS